LITTGIAQTTPTVAATTAEMVLTSATRAYSSVRTANRRPADGTKGATCGAGWRGGSSKARLGTITPLRHYRAAGPARNWLTIWKPTIVDLGLHRRVNPSMGNDVIITIAATSIRA
jgi:hypothetical protein